MPGARFEVQLYREGWVQVAITRPSDRPRRSDEITYLAGPLGAELGAFAMGMREHLARARTPEPSEREPAQPEPSAPAPALFGFGWLGSALASIPAFSSEGIVPVDGVGPIDSTSHDMAGAFGLVPLVGAIMASVEIAVCQVPAYVKAGPLLFQLGSRGVSDPGWNILGWSIAAVAQLAGFWMVLDPGTVVGLDPRPVEIAIVPSARPGGAMLALRGTLE